LIEAERIPDLFSLLHDGAIVAHEVGDCMVALTVEIEYLARRVDASYRSFRVALHGVRELELRTWPKVGTPAAVLTDLERIFQGQLEILEGEARDGRVRVHCSQAAPDLDHAGGELRFIADGADVIDPAGRAYTFAELAALAEAYWDEWSRS
jgi:hypothetical protein